MIQENINHFNNEIRPLCVISKGTFCEYDIRDIQTNIAWSSNPYGNDYAIVPDAMLEDIFATKGFCDIELNEDGTEVVSFTAKEIPEIPEEEEEPTAEERIAALEEENATLKATQAEQDEMILENNFNILVLQEGIADII